MENFVCLNCKYRFRSADAPKNCPYCDKNKIEKEKSAEDIVEEVGSILEE